ncbi:Z1 domain-containing protein [Streptomyces sp. NPDC050504]|uniref:Z1 domain-containing protein n=1 Tax=Streptomyces sp. NPDC050504 TaxID=3365618 RepID=UPI0037A54610
MPDQLLEIHTAVLGAMALRPKAFAPRARTEAEDEYPGADISDDAFRAGLEDTSGPLVALWRRTLAQWDFTERPGWSAHPPRTDERRADAYARLCFDYDLRKALDLAAPVSKVPGIVTISREFTPWYSRSAADSRAFYWPAYENYLRETKHWDESAIASLDAASHAVVERLADPTRETAYPARGLVVGYVQSGKTANFTGVTAKAVDAGYRLVIILGGTLNLLRGQTQRRIDMELVGRENILRGADPADPGTLVDVDYQDDEDWPEFLSHGDRPSALGSFEIDRLTRQDKDYQSLNEGIRALEFDKRDRDLPLYAPENLHRSAARLAVVKKNKSVLTRLVKDLRRIDRRLLDQIPALIIDDESDQASVNTTDPKKWEAGEVTRTAINGLISELLTLLPRAQYVGYTATPFANVFVDPSDEADIFPRDFLISLPRPVGYMGVQDFHDLDSSVPQDERTVANSQEKAHVRDIREATGDRLQEAVDAFILSGAIKLYRADHGVPEGPFRHHTMLVHESVRTNDHSQLALRINTVWHQAGYTSQAGHARLEALYDSDFREVSSSRAPADGTPLPCPTSYDDLKPYVSRARQLINSGGEPVVIVNGDTDRYFSQIDLDFDRTPHVWKILVGGTKLSRGFTVEGLTVTYYRRTTQQADTLMQMGRWFGFRPNYQDLVRLYIGREEPFGRSKTVDLYEAFEAICQDEEDFRAELSRYAELVDGKPQVTPAQIPPLVSQHLPWVKPSARNKMFNAELVEVRSPGEPIEPLAYPMDANTVRANTERWRPVLRALDGSLSTCRLLPDTTTSLTRSFQASTTVLPHAELLGVLGGLEWADGGLRFGPHLTYLAQLDGRLAKVDDWLVVAPRRTEKRSIDARLLDHGPFSLFRRKIQDNRSSFGRISGKEHRDYAMHLIASAQSAAPVDTTDVLGPHRGVVLLYPVVEAETDEAVRAAAASGTVNPADVTMAFTIVPPKSAIDTKRQLLRFRTKNSNRSGDVVVDTSQ